MDGLRKARRIYNQYGGKIFAIGRVIDYPKYYYIDESILHWNGRIFAFISDIHVLKEPIYIDLFSNFITISRQIGINLNAIEISFEKMCLKT